MKTIQNNTIRTGIKVALWEIRKLVWNKAFIISLLLTPVIWGLFMGLPRLFEAIEEPAVPPTTYIYVVDEIGIYESLSQKVIDIDNLFLRSHTGPLDDLRNRIEGDANAGYVHITEEIFETRLISVMTGTGDTHIPLAFNTRLKETLTRYELAMHNVEAGDIEKIVAGYFVSVSPVIEEIVDPMDRVRKWIPPIFAMIIFFMVFMSGMTTMQSATSDKRDKMIEILLSSVSASSLMYGKIVGNFFAGLIQVAVYLIYALMFIHFFGIPGIPIDISVFQLVSYIFSPGLPLLLFFALLGYFLFSSIYVGLGATMEDVMNTGNFQGIIMILPAFSFLFIFPVVADPNGIIAQIGSYIPFTASIVMILRITLIDLALIEIVIPVVILLASTVLMAKLAGKIFRTGMLMYGKEADPKEMWKWLRQ
ncbi:ABC transporter permease [Dehalococcoidia bacterium]|nr:ABC transporter permease [Dehalococcoidia bacterium]